MKSGANFQDINDIRAWAEEGKDAGEISQLLAIKPEVVNSFMPEKPKRKRRSPAEMAAAREADNESTEAA